jgi:hypothetical protein
VCFPFGPVEHLHLYKRTRHVVLERIRKSLQDDYMSCPCAHSRDVCLETGSGGPMARCSVCLHIFASQTMCAFLLGRSNASTYVNVHVMWCSSASEIPPTRPHGLPVHARKTYAINVCMYVCSFCIARRSKSARYRNLSRCTS